MFALRIWQIVGSLKAREIEVIGCQTGFVVVLGIGPRLLAPLRETFGRNPLYLICFTLFTLPYLLYLIYFTPFTLLHLLYSIYFTPFTLLQVPTALAKTLPVLITLRTFAGFFGSTYILIHREFEF
jgi:MFS family permease